MTKSTFKRGTCMSCGAMISRGKDHVCDFSAVEKKKGTVSSTPQTTKSRKLIFGKGKR